MATLLHHAQGHLQQHEGGPEDRHSHATWKVLTTVTKKTVIWYMIPCGLVQNLSEVSEELAASVLKIEQQQYPEDGGRKSEPRPDHVGCGL
jgi:hypothetical protein